MVMYRKRRQPVRGPESPRLCAKMQPLLLEDKQEVNRSMHNPSKAGMTCNCKDNIGVRR